MAYELFVIILVILPILVKDVVVLGRFSAHGCYFSSSYTYMFSV